jgi:hypothetical protein
MAGSARGDQLNSAPQNARALRLADVMEGRASGPSARVTCHEEQHCPSGYLAFRERKTTHRSIERGIGQSSRTSGGGGGYATYVNSNVKLRKTRPVKEMYRRRLAGLSPRSRAVNAHYRGTNVNSSRSLGGME